MAKCKTGASFDSPTTAPAAAASLRQAGHPQCIARRGLERKLALHAHGLRRRFPNVKLLSRYVMFNHRAATARIAVKGAADIAGKAVTLVITVVAARILN